MAKLLAKRIAGTAGFLLLFLLLVQVYFAVAGNAVYSRAGLNTEEQLRMQFENAVGKRYSCLILGNSRTYRGINPEYLNMPAYNFSHDNDSYNQIYWKLVYLEQMGVTFDTLILGTDYFMFSFLSDTRNEYYGELLPEGYMQDYSDSVSVIDKDATSWHERLNEDFNAYIVRRFQQPLTYLFFEGSPEQYAKPYLKSNGQYVDPVHFAQESDKTNRDGKRLEIQMEYFEKVLNYCKEKEILVVVVIPPTRDAELESYDQKLLQECDSYLKEVTQKHQVPLLNYAYEDAYKSYKLYTDITHLTPAAADMWTQRLYADLKANKVIE